MIAHRPNSPLGQKAGVILIGLCWISSGCESSGPPPADSWVVPPAAEAKVAKTKGKKLNAKQEDARLSGRERRALLKEKDPG
ncbi:hypothetical protein P12x_000622 [Tundrisphaera lichenicola]|uniref:hypothetical protein n=1 Tax=Tundrisphaera lichenicola TaxID=2029860 RepID=UPI003EBD2CAE